MCIFEYDEEKHMRSEREYAYKNGLEEGRKEGLERERFLQLLQSLADAGRTEDLKQVFSNQSYREQLYQEYNL